MKNMKFKTYMLVAMMGLSVTSCKDFLTLMPLNEVVLENFYTNEQDVESVLLGAYAALETNDCLERMSAWGEMRSDNIVANETSTNSDDDLVRYVKENFNDQNKFTTYLCFYKAINYANTALHYAPEVHAKDPNYHGSELAANNAEAIAIRSLCYWYLIRAFRDVPYTTIPSIDDTHDFFIGQTPFAQILDSLINDLNDVVAYAPVHYSSDLSKVVNTARFTRAGIYAMLADMYLWKGDWIKCKACCDSVIKRKQLDYEKIKADQGLDCTIELIHGYPLISEVINSTFCGNAYNEIFGTGNSFESLFELPFDRNRSSSFVSSYYNDQNSSTKSLKAADIKRGGSGLFTSTDTRFFENILSTNTPGIVKYVYQSMNSEWDMSLGSEPNSAGTRRQQNSYPNWIIYRFTDVLLMKAEALVMQAKEASSVDSVNALLQEAFDIVDAVNSRSICSTHYTTDAVSPLAFNNFNTVEKMEDLVFDERRRELMFEGKRWFDLVRRAMRNGDATCVMDALSDKLQSTNSSAVSVKFKSLSGLFLPINRDETKINDKLKQNPAYSENEHIKKAQ